MQIRTPTQIAQRALILGTISMRASCEVTDDPRAIRMTESLLPWLERNSLADALDPIERDLLSTAHGQLGPSLMMDAKAAGEAGALFCWTLGILDKPPVFAWADQAKVLKALRIGYPEAGELLVSPSTIDHAEIVEYGKHIRITLALLREARIAQKEPPGIARAVVEEIGRKRVIGRFAEAGVELAESDWEAGQERVAEATEQQRRAAAGIYLVRDIAVDWLFDSRETYFD